MTVQTYDPSALPTMTVTPKAAEHFAKRVQKEQGTAIRFSVDKSGCSGLKYVLGVVNTVEETDETLVISPELTIYIAEDCVPVIKGTEIDYIQEGINWVIKYRNPNETSSCGCGESFTVDPDKAS